jgi:hypothetical protein
MLDDLMKAITPPPLQRNLLLILAGLGVLVALGLIGLGLYFWPINQEQPGVVTSPTATATPAPTATPAKPGVVVIVATPSPAPTPTSTSQIGDTIPKQPTITRAPTNTPTTIPQNITRVPAPDGSIELIAPEDNIQLSSDTVEFRWRWRENKGCAQPPDGYAFEIRVWRDNNIDSPKGAMDAQAEKLNVRCDPNTGIRSFTIGQIRAVPGFERTREGRFRWDVALVILNPYTPHLTTQYRTFYTN